MNISEHPISEDAIDAARHDSDIDFLIEQTHIVAPGKPREFRTAMLREAADRLEQIDRRAA